MTAMTTARKRSRTDFQIVRAIERFGERKRLAYLKARLLKQEA
jgi:hypothetical protein